MPCPQVPEVLIEIFKRVISTKTGYQDLAALARTCRALYKPAITVLWHTIPSLLPLALCFPLEILRISRRKIERHQIISLKFARLPSLQDWERPLVHTKLIRSIGWTYDVPCKLPYWLPSSTLQTLLDTCPILPVLPGLQRLHYTRVFPLGEDNGEMNPEVSLAYLSKLSNPALLRSLSFSVPWAKPCGYDRNALMTNVFELCPAVNSLEVEMPWVDDSRKLSKNLTLLGSLQHLTSITILFFDHNISDLNLVHSFPALLDLSIYSDSLQYPIVVIQAIISPALRDIRLSVFEPNEQETEMLCTYIASRSPWKNTIRSLEIFGSPVSAQCIETLLVFKGLVHVNFSPSYATDAAIERAAKAWPMLEHVTVRNWGRGPRAALQSLVSLSRHCPCLRYLNISLDTPYIPPISNNSEAEQADLGPKRIRSQLLLEISEDSVLNVDPLSAAEFLLKLFPRLVLQIGSRDSQFQVREDPGWKRVTQIIDEKFGHRVEHS